MRMPALSAPEMLMFTPCPAALSEIVSVPSPVTVTQYRDQGVRPGVVYAYVVVAVDRATPPNESAPSNRQVVTSRSPSPGR